MEMSKLQQLKTGIFVIVGLVLICGSILMFGADRALFKSFVRLKVLFPQTQGLAQGSVVSLVGVTVGNVEKITFAGDIYNSLEVTLKIEKKMAERIRKGTLAEIRTQGALGDKFVYLIPGPAQSEILRENDIIPLAPATDLFSTITERGHEAERVFDILKEIHTLTKTLNSSARIDHILINLSQTTAILNQKLSELDLQGISQKTNSVMDKLDRVASKIDNGEGTLGALINDSTLHDRMKSLLGAGSNPKQEYLKSIIVPSVEKK